jgi:hypothetical protein
MDIGPRCAALSIRFSFVRIQYECIVPSGNFYVAESSSLETGDFSESI